MIQQRLSELSTDENKFNQVKGDYESALKNSGFGTQLKYSPAEKRPRNRKRNIIWFNPPFNSTLTTNLGQQFLALITKHFPQHHKFSKIFNRNTVKLSYSCSPNMKSVISGHNKSLLNSNKSPPAKPCNCRNKETCPLSHNRQWKIWVYRLLWEWIQDPLQQPPDELQKQVLCGQNQPLPKSLGAERQGRGLHSLLEHQSAFQ